MKRGEFVRRLVLNEICDDFENIDQIILPHVREDAQKCGLTVSRPEIVEALRGLVEDGLAKAYDLSGCGDPFSRELPGMPQVDFVEENYKTYFYVTNKGMDIQVSDGSWWPFDDEGSLREDWKPPVG
jgi:hypothetical protein